MRLICPNCGAQYEIDDHAIPLEGRDVQCSNCGHTWFQRHPSASAEAQADVEPPRETRDDPARGTRDDPARGAAAGWNRPETPWDDGENDWDESDDEAPAPERERPQEPVRHAAAALSGAAAGAVPRRQALDEDVAAILREEADREARARQAEASALESQGDLGLQETSRRDRAGSRAERFADPFHADDADSQSGKGRSVLPDIDQINTTLSPPEDAGDDDEEPDEIAREVAEKRGFRRGFSLTLLVGAILLAVYAFSPQIAQRIPALEQPLNGYVSVVNAGRAWLDESMKGFIAMINGGR